MRDRNYSEAEEHSVQYVLNAMFFCFWSWKVTHGRIFRTAVTSGLNRLVKLVTSKRLYEKAMANQKASEPLIEDLFFNNRNSFTIAGAYRVGLLFVPCGYCLCVSSIITALLSKYFGCLYNVFTLLLILIILAIIIEVWLYRNTLSNEIYLNYFNKFSQENKTWKVKWNLITVCFYLLGIVGGIGGLFMAIHSL